MTKLILDQGRQEPGIRLYGYIVNPNYSKSVATVMALSASAMRDFPGLGTEDIKVFVITKSLTQEGFMGVFFQLPDQFKIEDHPQYERTNNLNFTFLS